MKQFLFLDAAKTSKNPKILVGQKKFKNQTICHYHVLEKDQKEMKREPGDYFLIQFTDYVLEHNIASVQREFTKIVKTFLKKYHTDRPILVIGLGNSSIRADALGSDVTNQMIATNHYNDFLTIPKVALFNPEVISKTGISSFRLIQLVVQDLKPDLIILVDSFVTREKDSLNRVIEISDTGIIPGSALRTNKEINKKTFGIPILSIGVPLLFKTKEGMFASMQLDLELPKLSLLIAEGLNQSILF